MMERCTHQVPTLFSLASDVVKDNVLLYCHKDPNVTSIRDLRKCLFIGKKLNIQSQFSFK